MRNMRKPPISFIDLKAGWYTVQEICDEIEGESKKSYLKNLICTYLSLERRPRMPKNDRARIEYFWPGFYEYAKNYQENLKEKANAKNEKDIICYRSDSVPGNDSDIPLADL